MINHEKVYVIAKDDDVFNEQLKAMNEKMPRFFVDTLEKGIWAACYAGWVLGYHGVKEYTRRQFEWRAL